ncbi:MAG: hypothetical protein IPO32_18465 [Crocinitomicaceae bacterium]|nr:hypothetical protein [Crocinitomicaceae bacterium]
MLDIKFIRENPDLIKEAARKKHIDFNVDELVSVDQKRLEKNYRWLNRCALETKSCIR